MNILIHQLDTFFHNPSIRPMGVWKSAPPRNSCSSYFRNLSLIFQTPDIEVKKPTVETKPTPSLPSSNTSEDNSQDSQTK